MEAEEHASFEKLIDILGSNIGSGEIEVWPLEGTHGFYLDSAVWV